ncbi:hypothetical protein WDV94_13940 [Clavibacter tessellarius]
MKRKHREKNPDGRHRRRRSRRRPDRMLVRRRRRRIRRPERGGLLLVLHRHRRQGRRRRVPAEEARREGQADRGRLHHGDRDGAHRGARGRQGPRPRHDPERRPPPVRREQRQLPRPAHARRRRHRRRLPAVGGEGGHRGGRLGHRHPDRRGRTRLRLPRRPLRRRGPAHRARRGRGDVEGLAVVHRDGRAVHEGDGQAVRRQHRDERVLLHRQPGEREVLLGGRRGSSTTRTPR